MIIYGRNIIKEALKAAHPIHEIRATEEAGEHFSGLLESGSNKGIRLKIVHNNDLDVWTKGGVHQGIAAKIGDFENTSLGNILESSSENSTLVLLDQIQDPRNFGAIARTALAAGVNGIIMTQRRSAPISPAAVKAGAGAFFHIKTAYITNLARVIKEIKERGYWVYGAHMLGGQGLFEVDFAPKAAIAFGGEGKGLRPLIRANCDVLFKIPMVGPLESLNVSVAAAVTLYEIMRRKE